MLWLLPELLADCVWLELEEDPEEDPEEADEAEEESEVDEAS